MIIRSAFASRRPVLYIATVFVIIAGCHVVPCLGRRSRVVADGAAVHGLKAPDYDGIPYPGRDARGTFGMKDSVRDIGDNSGPLANSWTTFQSLLAKTCIPRCTRVYKDGEICRKFCSWTPQVGWNPMDLPELAELLKTEHRGEWTDILNAAMDDTVSYQRQTAMDDPAFLSQYLLGRVLHWHSLKHDYKDEL